MLVKLAAKTGVVGGTIYYLSQEGVWGDTSETAMVYDKINTSLGPYVDDFKQQLPFQIPDAPANYSKFVVMARHSWNKGVMATFLFLRNMPETISTWTERSTPRVKNFIASLTTNNK